MTHPTPRLSVVIITWNSERHIGRCLSTLRTDLERSHLRHEIIVIDNGSSDSTLQRLAELGYSTVTVVPLGSNTGTTFSRNIGLRMAAGEYICVLDSDIEFTQPNTLQRLIDDLDHTPGCGIIAPRLTYGSGTHQKSCDRFPTLFTKLKRLFFLKSLERQEGRQSCDRAEKMEVDYAISAFWLFRRILTDRIGLLDEHIFYAPEDVDYCARCWLGGLSVVYDPNVVAVHNAQEISRKRLFSKAALDHILGLLYYYRKYRCLLATRRLHAAIDRARNSSDAKDPAVGAAQHLEH